MANKIHLLGVLAVLFFLVSIGNARPWNPGDMQTVAWYDAADASTIHTDDAPGLVSKWDDKSGNTNDAIQASSGDQPSYTNSDVRLNGHPSVYNDTLVMKYLTTPNMAIGQLYVVCAFANTVTNWFDSHRALCNSADNTLKIQGKSNNNNWNTGGDLYIFYTDDPYKNGETNTTLLALPMTATMWRMYRSSTTSSVFRVMGGKANYQFWEGPVGEMVFTDGSESLEDQQRIEGYLAWKWDIDGSLPLYHPFKTAAPIFGNPGTLIILR